MIGLHSVPTTNGTTGLGVSDVAEAQLTSAVLVALELGDSCVGRLSRVETDHTSATRAAARLILDFRLLNIPDGTEELDEVFIASGPRELDSVSANSAKRGFGVKSRRERGGTHVSNIDDLASLSVSSGEVSEGVRGSRPSRLVASSISRASSTSRASTIATPSAAVATAEATAATEAATAAEASAEAATAAKASTKSAATHIVGESVHTDLKNATVPVVAVELLDCVAGIVRCLEYNDARALGTTVRTEVNIGTNNAASAS